VATPTSPASQNENAAHIQAQQLRV